MSDFLAAYSDLFPMILAGGSNRSIYLVGGAVRDMMLGRPIHDLDFVMESDASATARRVANGLQGAFYMLDEARDTARVITSGITGIKTILDFSTFRADGLEGDLRARDFRINAMALDLANLQQVIDPLGGAQDLRDRVLRLCAPTALQDDPARVLRAVRHAVDLNLRMTAETTQALHAAAGQLPRISPERARDELFRMLDGSRVASAVRLLDHFGVLPYLLPELETMRGVNQSAPHIHDVWNHTLAVLQALESLFTVLVEAIEPDKAANLALTSAVIFLGHYRPELRAHFEHPINQSRSLRALLFLAALYHDVGKPAVHNEEPGGRIQFFEHEDIGAEAAANRAQTMNLSGVETTRLRLVVQNHMRIHLLAHDGREPSRRAIYRFFRTTETAGIDLILLSLADTLATYGTTLPQETWENELRVCRALLGSYWETPQDTIRPQRLLSGTDLQRLFRLPPGPEIGRLLEELQEAQACGDVVDQPGAVHFIEEKLNRQN